MLTYNRATLLAAALTALFALQATLPSADNTDVPSLPPVKVERQPLAAQALRVAGALERLGEPLPEADLKALNAARTAPDADQAVKDIQAILDKRCLVEVEIRQGRFTPVLKAKRGPAKAELAEQGWRVFLVKVRNPSGVDGRRLLAASPNAAPLTRRSSSKPDPKPEPIEITLVRFLDLVNFEQQPLVADLSGLEVEYRVLSIYCRDPGKKEAALSFRLPEVGNVARVESEELKLTFDAVPAIRVKLRVKDHDGNSKIDVAPVMGAFSFTDSQGRVYPSPTRRLAPDFNFHPQVYRADGETIALPPGKYRVSWTRGPEYRIESRTMTVTAGKDAEETFALSRWVHPATRGWWSGDHHIHAGGCLHYESPTLGVAPEDMMRHILGEDLNVGCCLSWGPCWYHQKRYFEGKNHKLSTPKHLLRYDVEVSGFPSSHCGHICLLRLKEQDYPGTTRIEEWPSWDLPIFQWAKKQGGVVGFAHSGWGLDVGGTKELPNYLPAPMNGIGANEYLVDVAHDACDFISTVDTPSIWELNIWYHTLNCGFRARISGETDFPCIYGERVGLGRSYVHVPCKGDASSPLDFDLWVEGIRNGRCYVSDGKSHLMDFAVNGLDVGLKGSEVKLAKPGEIDVSVLMAGLLAPTPTKETKAIQKMPLHKKPYWDLERCRLGESRKVPVELVINGKAVARQEVEADGKERTVKFKAKVEQSSWVAVRVLPSSHTNPVFVVVGDKAIRVSKKSAKWCLEGIDKCWEQKKNNIRVKERKAAQKAYDEAREVYRKVLKECETE